MNTEAFRAWLTAQGYDSGTVRARVSNCQRVDVHEGDLDVLYHTDKCAALIKRLTYSTSDERANLKPLHDIPMTGNIRNGTATLKQSVNLYIRFMDGQGHAVQSPTPPVLPSVPPQATEHISAPTSSSALDSYAQFMEYFAIDTEAFYQYGLDNTIFADVQKAELQWDALKYNLVNDKPLHIRNYGRRGQHSALFIQLYTFLFGNNHIQVDPSNNTAPRNNLQRITGYRLRSTLLNYQCSHIFGHTKNPLLFEAVWNICFTPKLFDPLTGHEATGPWPAEYQQVLKSLVSSRFHHLIQDYNTFTVANDIPNRIRDFVSRLAGAYNTDLLQKFQEDAIAEWTAIPLHSEFSE